jgi:hypothetical protein
MVNIVKHSGGMNQRKRVGMTCLPTMEVKNVNRCFRHLLNDGNMKSWLCSRFQVTTKFDSQFFILRVIGCLSFVIINKLKNQNNGSNIKENKNHDIYFEAST